MHSIPLQTVMLTSKHELLNPFSKANKINMFPDHTVSNTEPARLHMCHHVLMYLKTKFSDSQIPKTSSWCMNCLSGISC